MNSRGLVQSAEFEEAEEEDEAEEGGVQFWSIESSLLWLLWLLILLGDRHGEKELAARVVGGGGGI